MHTSLAGLHINNNQSRLLEFGRGAANVHSSPSGERVHCGGTQTDRHSGNVDLGGVIPRIQIGR